MRANIISSIRYAVDLANRDTMNIGVGFIRELGITFW